MIALPESTAQLVVGEGTAEEIGQDASLGRKLIRLEGRAEWHGSEDYCLIRTAGSSDQGRFELRGNSTSVAGTGAFVWLACPTVYRVSRAGAATRVSTSQTQWRPTGVTQEWQPVSERCLGDVQLRVVETGHTLYRARARIAPSNFRLAITARTMTAGSLIFSGSSLTEVRILSLGVESTSSVRGTEVSVEVVSPTGVRPSLEVELRFSGKSKLALELPFPAEQRGFVSTDGHVLQNGERISVDTLGRWTARAISCEARQHFVLEANTGRGWRALTELPMVTPGLSELPLDVARPALEACLSGMRRIDASIQIRVVRQAGMVLAPTAHTVARLSWHEAELAVDYDGRSAVVALDTVATERLGEWKLSEFRVLAQPLHSPSSPAVELERMSDSSSAWFFAPTVGQLWLLTGWVGHALHTRPRLVRFGDLQASQPPDELPPTAEEQPTTNVSLGVAMRVQDLTGRRTALQSVFERLSNDLGHDDWEEVFSFLRTLTVLPPPTYDVTCALASAKSAAVLALLRQPPETFEAVWDALDQLGVSWHTIPFGLWLRAGRQGRAFALEHAEILGGAQVSLRQVLCGLFDHVENGPGFFSVLLAALHTYDDGFPPPPQDYFAMARSSGGRQVLTMQLRRFANDLRTRAEATDARFPPIRLSAHELLPDVDALLAKFGLADQPRFTWECLVAPLWAARTMATGTYVDSDALDDLRLLRSFDEEWFEAAHAAALTIFLGEGLEHDSSYFERAEGQVLRPEL